MRAFFLDTMTVTVILIIALLAAIDVTVTIIRLVRQRNKRRGTNLAGQVDSILAIAALMPFAACINPFIGMIRAMRSVATAGTGDPQIILFGLYQAFQPIFLAFVLFFIFFEIWFILREVHRRLSERPDGAPSA